MKKSVCESAEENYGVGSEAPKAARSRREEKGNGEGVSPYLADYGDWVYRKVPQRPKMSFGAFWALKIHVSTRKFSIFDIFVTHKNCLSV